MSGQNRQLIPVELLCKIKCDKHYSSKIVELNHELAKALQRKRSFSLRVQRSVLRRSEIGQKGSHLVEGSPSDCFVVAAAGQVVADLLLVDPEQAV